MSIENSKDMTERGGQNEPSVEERIRLEKAKKATHDAERKKSKQLERQRKTQARTELLKRIPLKVLIAVGALSIVLAICIPTAILPSLLPEPEPTYLSESNLEDVVSISNITSVDYVYKGIAEKTTTNILGGEQVEYRVRYTAHVRASFDIRNVKFGINEEERTIDVTIPDPIIDAPELDEQTLDYMPEKHSGNIAEAIKLCKEDAAREVKSEGLIEEKAFANIQSTIRALTLPLIGDEYELVWLGEDGMPLGGEAE